MNRRRLLGLISAGAVAVLAGCGDAFAPADETAAPGRSPDETSSPTPRGPPELPDGMTAATFYAKKDVLWAAYGLGEDGYLDAGEVAWTVIRDGEEARNSLKDDDELDAFVETTEFDDSYLLLLQYGTRPASDLHLDVIERTDDGLRVAIAVVDNPGGDALTTHSLLVRITDERAGAPAEVEVRVDGS